MIEKEIKILVNKNEYEKLNKLFKWDKAVTQINYYYNE